MNASRPRGLWVSHVSWLGKSGKRDPKLVVVGEMTSFGGCQGGVECCNCSKGGKTGIISSITHSNPICAI